MEPSILDGQKILMSNIPYFWRNPRVGDIVAFKFKDKIFVKRIKSIDKGKYFLEGDNKKDSLDSNKLGDISRRNILGKIIYV